MTTASLRIPSLRSGESAWSSSSTSECSQELYVFICPVHPLTSALLCPVRVQDCRSPARPERTLSSHVSAGGNHRPQLRSWKSTALGLWGRVGAGGNTPGLSGFSVLSHVCLTSVLSHSLSLCLSLTLSLSPFPPLSVCLSLSQCISL